jgi:hypothetical protein
MKIDFLREPLDPREDLEDGLSVSFLAPENLLHLTRPANIYGCERNHNGGGHLERPLFTCYLTPQSSRSAFLENSPLLVA